MNLSPAFGIIGVLYAVFTIVLAGLAVYALVLSPGTESRKNMITSGAIWRPRIRLTGGSYHRRTQCELSLPNAIAKPVQLAGAGIAPRTRSGLVDGSLIGGAGGG